MRKILSILISCIGFQAFSQPANDNCANPAIINIPLNGYGLGTVASANSDLSGASTESGETFYSTINSAGQTAKSVWFQFTLPTARKCTLSLKQPTPLINSNSAGFTVYKASNCFPTTQDANNALLASQPLFGWSTNPCLKAGTYLVQVSAKNTANGPVYIELELSAPEPATYDKPANAYNFGVLQNNTYCESQIDLSFGCYSLDSLSETCPTLGTEYSQSAWFTFNTGSYYDFIRIAFGSVQSNNSMVLGYRLYQGDVHLTPPSALTVIEGCTNDTLNRFGNGYWNTANNAFHDYDCGELQLNTTYSVQVFSHRDVLDNVRVTVEKIGTQAANSTQPLSTSIIANNQLGVLPTGETVRDNYFACNSRLSQNACGNANPATGVNVSSLGTTYDMALWYTFTVSQLSNVHVNAATNPNLSLTPPPYIRIFNANVNTSCNTLNPASNLVYEGAGTIDVICMPPGQYSVQILGESQRDIGWCGRANHLGNKVTLTINVDPVPINHHYSLATSGAVDSINREGTTFGAIQPDTLYNSHTDELGCENTVLPEGDHCGNATKGVYVEFEVGDGDGNGIPDSGFVNFSFNPSWDYQHSWNILYRGDAMSLANAQNAHHYPDSIGGLTPITPCVKNQGCYNNRACVVPGIYTMVTYADSSMTGGTIATHYTLDLQRTIHHSAALAEDMGSILDSVSIGGDSTISSGTDWFSCLDNPATIGGLPPCDGTLYNTNLNRYEQRTKLIYRQFYLSDPTYLAIATTSSMDICQHEVFTVFQGKATDGISVLSPVGDGWTCTKQASTPPCAPLPAGWYTIVTYGEGPTYENPTMNYSSGFYGGGDLGISNQISITVQPASSGPQHNQPETAAIDSLTGQPFLLTAGNRGTADYPVTDTVYYFYGENFDCTTDTPFYFNACNSTNVRAAYYVFSVPQESYLHFRGIGSDVICQVYPGNVRTSPSVLTTNTPLQPCINGSNSIQLCRVQPGTYTLVMLIPDSYNGSSISPSVYVDITGYSRFDHASQAYDFSVITPDSTWHNGKMGDVHPTNVNLAPSNDFFFCTTGARNTDPLASGLCSQQINPAVYNSQQTDNHLYNVLTGSNPRRNLWYSFVLEGGGYCRVKVRTLTAGKGNVHFKVYKSNVDGSLPFTEIQTTGEVDSSLAQGLSLVANSKIGTLCYIDDTSTVSFYSQGCALRYYVVVDLKHGANEPNEQIDVSVLWDTLEAIYPQGDFCSNPVAGTLSGMSSISLSATINCHTIGEGYGEDGYGMACLTPSGSNINNYQSTWYRFDITSTDTFDLTPVLNNLTNLPADSIRYRLMYGNCSAMNIGSCFVSSSTINTLNCLTQGTYYIQVVTPRYTPSGQWTSGDITLDISTAQSPPCNPVPNCFAVADFTVSSPCNTDTVFFGNISTQGDSVRYRWDFGYNNATDTVKNPRFVYPVSGLSQTYSVTLYTTNLLCNSTDTITKTVTVYKKPKVNLGNDTAICAMTSLTLNAGTHPGATYLWQNGSPDSLFTVTNSGTYRVQVSFNGCTVYDTITVSVKPLPVLNLGNDVLLCSGNRYYYNATQANASYLWNTGSTSPIIDTSVAGTYSLTVTMNGCSVTDAITLSNAANVLPLGNDTAVCTNGNYVLNTITPNASSYLWDNGLSGSTRTINSSGIYWVDIVANGCSYRDSIVITISPIDSTFEYRTSCFAADTGTIIQHLQNRYGCDSIHTVTTILIVNNSIGISGMPTYCVGSSTTLTASQGFSYLWNDTYNSTTQSITVTAGTYTVTITDENGCSTTASTTVTESPVIIVSNPSITDVSCNGGNDGTVSSNATGGSGTLSYAWSPSQADTGAINNLSAGTYLLTVTDANGCSVSAYFTVNEPQEGVASINPSDTTIQFGEQLTLNSSLTPFGTSSINSYHWSPSEGLSCDDCTNPVVNSYLPENEYTLVITYNGICKATASANVFVEIDIALYIPNAFTPNGDGNNDVFEIFGKNIKTKKLKIFNRWGEKVFDSMDTNLGWNGIYKGVLQPPMVYVYDAEIEFWNGVTKHRFGSVTLIR